MKILLLLENYLPTKNGGMENYTHWLASMLYNSHQQVEVAYLNIGESDNYVYENIPVRRLVNRFDDFTKLLSEGNYDICHIHEYSGEHGINIRWFKAAKLFCKVFFTFHLPYLTCYKGDFRYLGIEDCSDFSSVDKCAYCVVATQLKYRKTEGFSLYNFGVEVIGSLAKNTNKVSALKKRIADRKDDLDELMQVCDRVFVYANWFKNILHDNGYQSDSIRKIPYITKTAVVKEERDGSVRKRLLFVGRIEQQKGLYLLSKAMNLLSTSGIELDVFGNIVNQQYFDACRNEYNFNFKGTLNRIALLQLLPSYDFLVLPSVFPEMYSMMVKDAFYEQLPVIASASKGNKDAVQDGVNGFIFPYDDHIGLATVIDRAYDATVAGWKPDFSNNANAADDLQEILSYYV